MDKEVVVLMYDGILNPLYLCTKDPEKDSKALETCRHGNDSHERGRFYTHISPERGGLCQAGPHGEAPGGPGGRGRGSVDQRLHCSFREGVDKAGGQAEGWLVWIIPAGSGPQGPSLVVWYLPWVMRAGGQGTRGGEPHGGGGGGWALGWLVCIGRLCS